MRGAIAIDLGTNAALAARPEQLVVLSDDGIGGAPPPGSAKYRPTPAYQPKTPATDRDFARLAAAQRKREIRAEKRARAAARSQAEG